MTKVLSRQTLIKLILVGVPICLCLCNISKAQNFARIQNDSNGSKKVTIVVNDVSINDVLKVIKRATGLSPFMSGQAVDDLKEKVSLSIKEERVDNVLQQLLEPRGYSYHFNDNVIVIRKKENASPVKKNTLDSSITKTTLTGKVTDASGTPIIGATVVVKGTKDGTTTDTEGKFALPNVDRNATLLISSIGYEAREVQATGKSILAQLNVVVSDLDETVVIAYGTTTQRLNTGNVSTIKAKDIEKQPVSNPLQALQGRVAGMEITQNTGLPGSGITVRIRGNSSITNGNDPLYIVDGVPYTSQLLPNLGNILGTSGGPFGSGSGNPLSFINPADIESIDVLKDADATAIYGSRAANGAVLITTKRGKAGQTRINVNMYTGWGKVTRKLDLMNKRQYLDMRYEALENDGIFLTPTTPGVYDLTQWDTTRNTDWQKELIGGTARYSHVQASVSGGSAFTQYLISGTWHKETTVFPGDLADQKGSLHFNITSSSANQKLRIVLSGNYQIDDNRLMREDLTNRAIQLAPVAPPIYNTDGSLNWANSTWQNPLAQSLLRYKSRTNNLISNATISYQLLPGLQLKNSMGYSNLQTDEVITIPLKSQDPAYWPFIQRSASFTDNTISSWIIEPQATWSVNLGGGELTTLVGTTIQQKISRGQILEAQGFNSDYVMEDIKAAPKVTVGSTVDAVYKYNALFGRLNYNWQSRYLLNLTARRDGSSRFGPESRFHNFGAVGAAWIFSNEHFVRRMLPLLSHGKLRVSYGTTGSDQVGDYRYMDLYRSTNVSNPYQGANGLMINNLFNPNLAWEETRKMEAGLELAFFKDRIFFTTSYYRHRSSNQLTSYKLPSVTGFISIDANQNAMVQNTGWEFLLNTVNIHAKNISWTSSFNFTINRNKLVSIDSGFSSINLKQVGQPLNSTFVYHFLGVDEATGVYQVADNHGGPTLTPNSSDATELIDLTPRFYGGLQNNISYKGFSLDFLFQFVKQRSRNYLMGILPGATGFNQPVSVLTRWQKVGDVTNIQRFNSDFGTYGPFLNAGNSDIAYSDASFIRLKNLSLSLQLWGTWIHKAHIQSCRIYIQGQNLLTITSYKGFDPETRSVSSLPPLRVLTAGIQLIL